MKLAIIADDFTGSNDTGVQFAKKGLKTVVTTKINEVSDTLATNDVLVFDTESRFDTDSTAYEKVHRVAKLLKKKGTRLLYKKIDSTFRGNIGSELAGIMDGFGSSLMILIPALPSNGRKTVGGNVLVHDMMLHETEVANDPKTPVNESYIPDIISKQTKKQVKVLSKSNTNYKLDGIHAEAELCRKEGIEILVIDAETNDDLVMLSEAISRIKGSYILAGTAGLAEFLTDAYELKEIKPILSILGSVSGITRKQIEYASYRSKMDIVDFPAENMFDTDKIETLVTDVINLIKCGKNVAIRTAKDESSVEDARLVAHKKGMNDTEISEHIAITLGDVTKLILNESCHLLGGIFITGGDTLIKIASRLGIEGMVINDEVLPAIPIGRFIHDQYNNIDIVTKAGAFGSEEALSQIIDYMEC